MNKYLNSSRKTLNEFGLVKSSPLLHRGVVSCAILCSLCVLLCMISLCSCSTTFYESNSDANKLPQPAPYDGIAYSTNVTLYYRFLNTSYLVPIDVSIDMTSNEQPEISILKTLFAGIGSDDLYKSAIPNGTELISVFLGEDILFVTLNEAFVNTDNSSNGERQLAVCQIVNTITSYDSYSVQILIDRNNDGVGDRVSYSDLGFDKSFDEQYDYAAPFDFIKGLVASPSTILDMTLYGLSNSDYDDLPPVFSTSSSKVNVTNSDISHFCSETRITAYSILEETVFDKYARVLCTITFRTTDTDKEYVFRGTLEMPKYGRIYKVPYEQLINAAGGLK